MDHRCSREKQSTEAVSRSFVHAAILQDNFAFLRGNFVSLRNPPDMGGSSGHGSKGLSAVRGRRLKLRVAGSGGGARCRASNLTLVLWSALVVGVLPLVGLFVLSELRHSARIQKAVVGFGVGAGSQHGGDQELSDDAVNSHRRDWDDSVDDIRDVGHTDDLEFEVRARVDTAGAATRSSAPTDASYAHPAKLTAATVAAAAPSLIRVGADATSSPPPTLPAVHGPRKLLLVCLFTGGVSPVAVKEKAGSDGHADVLARINARVDAQVSSWAADDVDVYHVTHANISNPRVIRLPIEAESGGYKGLWLKTLLLFDHLANTGFGRQYDYIFKGDDDTLVNLPEMRRLLRALDPSVPFQLGNNGYGVGCRGPAPTSLFFRQNRGTDPCHGGAGYVLSRGLLELAAPRFRGCADEWPSSSYEDAKLSYCLMRHAAANCIGMKHDFGWDRCVCVCVCVCGREDTRY
jgi:hypothetical protein